MLSFSCSSGSRSQVKFAQSPAATCSSRAVVSATGRMSCQAAGVMTGRGGYRENLKNDDEGGRVFPDDLTF